MRAFLPRLVFLFIHGYFTENNLENHILSNKVTVTAINQLLPGLQLPRCSSVTYLAIKGLKTSDKGQIPTFSTTFPPTPLQCNWLELGKPTTSPLPGIKSPIPNTPYIYSRATYMNMTNALQIYKFVSYA